MEVIMKSINKKVFLGTLVVLLFTIAGTAQAYRQCTWVEGYWRHGYYHHAHKVCWNNAHHHCRWVHTNHGSYRNCW